MLSGCTVATFAEIDSGIGSCSGGVLMFGPRGISTSDAAASDAGLKMCTASTYGLSSGGSSMSGGSPYSRGSVIFPSSIETAATAGEHRYTQSSAVPLRPGKLRFIVRSELAPEGGAWPIPTHGPQ